MAKKVVLHVGAMKSGTSFIQSTLGANRKRLAEQDVLFPGRQWRNQVYAISDVLGHAPDGVQSPRTIGAWQKLLDEIEDWQGTAIISMEYLGPTPVAQIEKIVDALSPAHVEAVLSVRDLARNIPAMWQEEIQNGSTWSWDEFIDAIQHGNPGVRGPSRQFWRHQRTPAIAARWSRIVGKEDFRLITVPPAGAPPEMLLERFATAFGIDVTGFAPPKRRNQAIGAASATMLRELNLRLDGELPHHKYNQLVKHGLAKNGLSARRDQEATVGYNARWVRRRSAAMLERLKLLDLNVIGDLNDLTPSKVPGVNPSRINDREELDAALDGLAHMIRVWSRS
jgi:hypothetical protein